MIRSTALIVVCLLAAGSGCGGGDQAVTVNAEALAPSVDDPSGPPIATVAGTADDATAVADQTWVPATLVPGGPPAMPASVNVIGDSIALSAQPIVSKTLESLQIEIVAYDAVESRRMVTDAPNLPSGASAIEGAVARGTPAELWIVALGTNDVGAMADAETVRADIERVLSLVPADAHLFWIDTWFRDLDELAAGFNTRVREMLAERPYSWVLDWHEHAAADGLIIHDGVHLSEVGKVEYARMIGDALRANFDRP